MHASTADQPYSSLPPLVGVQVAIISAELERSYDRARGLEEFGYRVTACGDPASAPATVHDAGA